jgi:uncharacterized protein (TIGR03663 family)
MKWQKLNPVIWILILVVAAAFHLSSLSLRPMHTDEAVGAVRFSDLLEKGEYHYNPQEYHGPSLYYLTLPGAWLRGYKTLIDLDETILRLVPVFFGLLTICIFIIFGQYINHRAMMLAALFYAVSSPVVFYNRYYIHETLLSTFVWSALIFVYLYIQKNKPIYLLLSGICLGFIISTKETWMIYMGAALLVVLILPGWRRYLAVNLSRNLSLFFLPALLTVGLFFSSFFSNPGGIIDFFQSFKYYFPRGAGETMHVHPWYYYIQLLLYSRTGSTPFWTEIFIVALALLGFIFIFIKKSPTSGDLALGKFISVFTVLVISIYSVIPYKTPWNILGCLPGIFFLAGWAADYLLIYFSKKYMHYLISLILFLGFAHQVWQSWQLNYHYPSDPINPYVYAHPGEDIFLIEKKMREIMRTDSPENKIWVDVVVKDHEYWPLPWYLRAWNQIGWWDRVDPATPLAPVILISADLEDDLVKKIYEDTPVADRKLYLPLFSQRIELRPGTELLGFIRYDNWQIMASHYSAFGNQPK